MSHRNRLLPVLVAAALLFSCTTASAGGGYQPPVPFAIPLTDSGRDQLLSAAAGPDGGFYAAGFVEPFLDGPRSVLVLRLTSAGALDPGFGNGGVAVTPLTFTGGGGEIHLVVQDGRPVVCATVANAIDTRDNDVALVRLLADGTVDAGFGNAGVRVVDVNTAYDDFGVLLSRDAARGLALGPDGSLFVHASARATGDASGGGPRLDTNMTMLRLTPDGDVDTAWGDGGFRALDLTEANETARGLVVLEDGSAIGVGYGNTGLVTQIQPILYRVDADGDLDTGFAGGAGVFHQDVAAASAEAYGAVMVDDALVVAGYGRPGVGVGNQFLAFRLSLAGVLDTSWGGAPGGVVLVDPSAVLETNNARGAVALPLGGVAIFGSTGPANQPAQDASFAILTRDGALDTRYGQGFDSFVFGNDGNDQFWGGAYNERQLLLVGYKGGGIAQTSEVNDDAWAVLLPIVVPDPVFRDGFEDP